MVDHYKNKKLIIFPTVAARQVLTIFLNIRTTAMEQAEVTEIAMK